MRHPQPAFFAEPVGVVAQSVSTASSQPAGQQPSSSAQETISTLLHAALQLTELPVMESMVQACPSSQSVGQDPGGSQVSPTSTLPSPQVVEQSLSLLTSQAAGQQPSSLAHETMTVLEQAALQVAALPVMASRVHTFESSQSVGQVDGGSQVSPASTTPLPHEAEQSISEAVSQPVGQHPSPSAQLTMATFEQATLQLAALPVMVSPVHAFPSSQSVGQLDGGSQVSPASTAELPQLALQSPSVV